MSCTASPSGSLSGAHSLPTSSNRAEGKNQVVQEKLKMFKALKARL